MEKKDRKKMAAEWKRILHDHPAFARAFLAQQSILMEASESGYRLVDKRMCALLKTGLPVLFENFWVTQCEQIVRGDVEIGGLIGCLSDTNRDPAGCFGSEDDDGWFDDPLAGGRTLPPKSPIPPLK